MKTNLDILKRLTPILVLLTAACGHDELVAPDVYEEVTTPYVELRIAIPAVNPSSTRANPMGGEEGNGRERGIINEDKIHDINIFFYKDPKGLDGKDTTSILHHIYFNIDNEYDEDNTPLLQESSPIFEKNYLRLQFGLTDKFEKLGVGTKFAAIANIGAIQENDIKTLGQLRSLDVTAYSINNWWGKYDEFSVNAMKMDYFLMSTAYNDNLMYSDYEYTGKNQIEKSGDNYTGTTTLERMYARIDLWYNAKKNGGIDDNTKYGANISEQLEYSVDDTDNKVYIFNVLPVNVMKTPSYLFKKVTSILPASWNVADLKNIDSFKWGGRETTNASGEPSSYVMERTTGLKTSDGKALDDYDDWYGNTKVKTVIDNIQRSDKGKFGDYYSESRGASGNDPTDYDCDRISIISYANENTHAVDCFHPNYLTGLAFRAVYVPAKICGADGKTPIEDDIVPTVIYRYSKTGQTLSESSSIYFADMDDVKTYARDHKDDMAVITEFTDVKENNGKWGFVCYYNLWLRHYNDEVADPQETYPMEYATVRNNIYRVKVEFTGPGDPTPTMREPDTMKARIFVRKWNYREESEIIF